MNQTSKTIVFFGSGPVAAKALEKLIKHTLVECVITKPKPNHHIHDAPVINICEKYSIKRYEVENKLELNNLFSKLKLNSKVGLVLDYGIIISKSVIDYFPLGIVNSHFSLLPKLRGADPISYAILSGENVTGVSLMLINEKMDEGPILVQEKLDISINETSKTLTERLIVLSDRMISANLTQYVDGDLNLQNQKGIPTYSKKLNKTDSILDWYKPAVQLEREVRAYIDWPRSRTNIFDVNVVVTKASVIKGIGKQNELYLKDNKIGIYTTKDIFIIERLIPENKKEMSSYEFLLGYKK